MKKSTACIYVFGTFLVLLSLTEQGRVIASGIAQAVIPQAVPTAYKQGNGTKFQLAGTVSGAGATLCTDANGNTTTSGCTSGGSAGATLFSTTDSTTVTAASATTLIGTVTGSTTVPANTFIAGSMTEILAEGYYTTPIAARTLTIDLLIGGSARITTGALVVLPSVTNGVWRLHCGVTTRTAGVSGTQIANCIFETAASSLAVLTPANGSMHTASTWTVDTTGMLALDLQATWDATTGSPSITSTNVAAWIPGAPVTSVFGQTGAIQLFNPNPQTTTYQVLAADFNSCKVVNVASGTFTATLVASGSQPAAGKCIYVLNFGSGVVTIARSGQNINGAAANLTLSAGSASAPTGAFVVSDGSNYFAQTFGGGGGTTVTTAVPYVVIGGTKVVAATMFPFTALFSGSFLDAQTFTVTASANGNVVSNYNPSGAQSAWYSVAATTSIEAEFQAGYANASGNFSGIWLCDSTNNNVWLLELTSANAIQTFSATLSGCNAGTPSSFANVQTYVAQPVAAPQHFKLSVSGGTLTFAVSLDGGQTFTTVRTQAVGTIAKAGIAMRSGGTNAVFQITNWLSVVVI